jgi:DNA mismatch repair protein MSH6
VYSFQTCTLDSDKLLPREGNDEEYDRVMAEIGELEATLDNELKTYAKTLKCALLGSFGHLKANVVIRCELTYWHSAQATKVSAFAA